MLRLLIGILLLTAASAFACETYEEGCERDGDSVPFTNASVQPASACAELVGQCEYYECRNSEMECGTYGYLIGFGARCKNGGQPWQDQVNLCIQQELEKRANLTCTNVRNATLQAQMTCLSL